MRKLLPTLLFIIGITSFVNAQWISPGEGITYTLPDLVTVTNGVVTNTGNVFAIHADLTISERDVLLIDNQVTRIDAPGVLITIKGSMTCSNTSRVKLYGGESPEPKFSMRFENATACDIHNMYLSDGAGIQIIESEVTFDDVKFVYFTEDYCHSVIDIFNSNPVINNCFFMLNDGPAISSPANGQSSPRITNCTFDSNSDKSVNPQVNLGPGSTDTIVITGNEFDGTYDINDHVGGLSIADLLGIGDTKVILQNNVFKEGRYGYNQQGQTISSLIIENQFINNNHESNPMNGGSGISIYGTSVNNKAILRGNVITGNLWGITAINLHDIDLGTEEEWGSNEIHDNGNNGTIYDLYNNATCDIMAIGNNWGATQEQVVEDHIFHQTDDPSLGLVTFIPFFGYDQIGEIPIESADIDLTKAVIYSITGQRVNHDSLKPGVYVVQTAQGARKIIIQ